MKLIKTGNREVDRLLNKLVRRSIKLQRRDERRKATIKERKANEAKLIADLRKEHPKLFNQTYYKHKTTIGALNYLEKATNDDLVRDNIRMITTNYGKFKSVKWYTTQATIDTGRQVSMHGYDVLNKYKEILDEHNIRGEERKMRLDRLRDYKTSFLQRDLRYNRDEVKVHKWLIESITNPSVLDLGLKKDGTPYAKSTLTGRYMSADDAKFFQEYQKFSETEKKKYVPLSRAGSILAVRNSTNEYNIGKTDPMYAQFIEWSKEDHLMSTGKEITEIELIYKIVNHYVHPDTGRLTDLLSPS